jgi:hypothetical protein
MFCILSPNRPATAEIRNAVVGQVGVNVCSVVDRNPSVAAVISLHLVAERVEVRPVIVGGVATKMMRSRNAPDEPVSFRGAPAARH